jgi:hypothetical protein
MTGAEGEIITTFGWELNGVDLTLTWVSQCCLCPARRIRGHRTDCHRRARPISNDRPLEER